MSLGMDLPVDAEKSHTNDWHSPKRYEGFFFITESILIDGVSDLGGQAEKWVCRFIADACQVS
jgi:hypothetical protein